MSQLVHRLVLGCLLVGIASVTPGQAVWAAEPAKEDEASQKRVALWQALKKALPKKYNQIDVYGVNPALTQVLFRSQGATLLFSLKTGKVKEVQHMKALGKINCITFEKSKGGGEWVLWYNGQRELTIGAEK